MNRPGDDWPWFDSCSWRDVEPMAAQLVVEGGVVLGEPCDVGVCCESMAVSSGWGLEAAAGGCVLVPSGRTCPLGALAWLPVQRISDEGKLDGGAVRSHGGGRIVHEVFGVDDDRWVPSSVLHSDEEGLR
jgi:hypothetical protein